MSRVARNSRALALPESRAVRFTIGNVVFSTARERIAACEPAPRRDALVLLEALQGRWGDIACRARRGRDIVRAKPTCPKGIVTPGRGTTIFGRSTGTEWRDRVHLAAGNALLPRPPNEDAPKDEEVKRLRQRVGELVLERNTRTR